MAHQFLQMVVLVERRNPSDLLHGSVTGVEAGLSLTLSNVWSYGQQRWFQQVVLDPNDIVQLTDTSKDPNFAYNQPPPQPPVHKPQAPLPFHQHPGPVPVLGPGPVPGPMPAHAPAPVHAPAHAPAPIPIAAAQPAQQTHTKPALVDPAILSITPRSSRPNSGPGQQLNAQAAVPPAQTAAPATIPSQTQPTAPAQPAQPAQPAEKHPELAVRVKGPSPLKTVTPTSTLYEPMSAQEAKFAFDNAEEEDAAAPATPQTQTQDGTSKARRRPRNNRAGRGNAGPNNGSAVERGDGTPQRPKESAGRGKGWRNSPMLEPTASFPNSGSGGKKTSGRKQRASNDLGWASDNVTEVQEAGEFDFEMNLAKFDKRTLFDQMRRDDQVDDADRLVGHNRNPVPRPGTGGGKNYHHTQNVLEGSASTLAPPKILSKRDQAVSTDFWNSEADIAPPASAAGTGGGGGGSGGAGNGVTVGAGGDRSSGRELGMGSRQSSRRGDSKVSATRKAQARKASAGGLGQGPSRVNSIAGPSSTLRQSFYTMPSQRRLETVSALQMLNLENIAHNELGLTEDMMAENAGRGIAEVALTALNDPAIKVRAGQNSKLHGKNGKPASSTSSLPSSLASQSHAPTIVVLAGNNKNGSRAVAASRHLRNKGINVLLCVVNVERGSHDLQDDLRQQILLYRNFGGHVYNKSELFEHLRKATIPILTIDTPRSAALPTKAPAVTLIIDALLGLAVSFDELRTGDRAAVYELIEWANRNEAFVLSVDVPSGIDPSSGAVTFVDGAALYVRPRYVVALGAPKRGLLEIIAVAEMADQSAISGTAHGGDAVLAVAAVADDPAHDWRLFVADMGFGAAVWKKAGTKIRRGIDFDDKWVLEMGYRGLDADDSA